MDEILPGLLHWTAYRDTIGADVHSYLHVSVRHRARSDGPARRPRRASASARFAAIVLTNRHHYRDADAYRDRFGATVHCHEAGLHEFGPSRTSRASRGATSSRPG